jgi:cell division protein FtsI (penicillin-binding protein 3)
VGERRQHPSKRNQSQAAGQRGAKSPAGSGRTLRTKSTGAKASAAKTTRTPRTNSPKPTTKRTAATGARANSTRPSTAGQKRGGTSRNRTSRKLAGIATSIKRTRRRRKVRRIPLGATAVRVRVIGIAMAIAISLCAGRLLQLQGFDAAAYGAIASANLTTTTPLLPARGQITDRNGSVLAATEPAVDITADPTLTAQDCTDADQVVGPLCGLQQATRIAQIIGAHTEVDLQETVTALTRDDTRFVYVKKKVPANVYTDISDQLEEENLPGIYRESNPIRTYPSGTVAPNVVGFVNSENQGQAGVEYALNSELAGVEGKETYEMAPNGSRIPLGESTITPAKNGVNYQLTIDSELQWAAQRLLNQALEKTGGDSATAITMDVTSGEILAMADAPGYDSNQPGETDPDNLGARAVSRAYEPGSVEKILTSAALIDSGSADPDTKVVVPARVSSGDGQIKDAWEHGTLQLTMRGVVSHSSNIGTVLLSRQMEKSQLRDYLTSFGLGEKTGIELPGESAGQLPAADMEDYTRDQIAFGQGLSVTAVQEAAAIASVVNGGVYHAPTVVKSATTADGTPVSLDRPESRRVISEESSAQVRDLMESVVTRTPGTQDALMLQHYSSGGKTGTAERYDPDCGCYRGYVTSFVGFAPLDNPKLMTYVVVDNPKRGESGTETAAPTYSDIMELALPRYGIVPDQKNKSAGAAKNDRPIRW